MSKLKEYSYLLMLITSILLVAGAYWGGFLPKSLLKEMQDDTIAREHMTLSETEENWAISRVLESIKAYWPQLTIERLKESFTEKILSDWVSGKYFSKQPEGKESEGNDMSNTVGETVSENETEESEDSINLIQQPLEETESDKNHDSQSEESIFENIEYQNKEYNEGSKKDSVEESIAIGKEEPSFYTGDSSYFKDALFIGDSRTEGLREYGGLGEATIISDSGLSIYRLWKDTFQVKDIGKVGFEEVLRNKRFKKVYLMMGINELGYDHIQTIKKYEEALRLIEETQPGAVIYLMANLHVTDEKSQKSDIFNNVNINRFNRALEALARKKKYIYLDVNPLFDDSGGNLAKEYTYDHAHILGVYYTDWVNWILEHCV